MYITFTWTNLLSHHSLQKPRTEMKWGKKPLIDEYFLTTSSLLTVLYIYFDMFALTVKFSVVVHVARERRHRARSAMTMQLGRNRVKWTQDMCRRAKQVRLISVNEWSEWKSVTHWHFITIPCFTQPSSTCDAIKSPLSSLFTGVAPSELTDSGIFEVGLWCYSD